MSFLPLTLGVGGAGTKGGGGQKPSSKTDPDKILQRDDYTCRFCGFRSSRYQRVVPSAEGHVTACGFCEQVMSLERAAMMGGGHLIWLPELSQAELNHIVRAAYVAREADGEMAKAATRTLDALTARRGEAKKRLGSDDPLVLATVMYENLNQKERQAAQSKLDGVRFLPLDRHMVRGKNGEFNGFPQMIDFWRSKQGPFADMSAPSWKALLAKVA